MQSCLFTLTRPSISKLLSNSAAPAPSPRDSRFLRQVFHATRRSFKSIAREHCALVTSPASQCRKLPGGHRSLKLLPFCLYHHTPGTSGIRNAAHAQKASLEVWSVHRENNSLRRARSERAVVGTKGAEGFTRGFPGSVTRMHKLLLDDPAVVETEHTLELKIAATGTTLAATAPRH